MRSALPYSGPHRLFVPAVLGVIMVLVFGGLSGGPARMLARRVDQAKELRTQIATLNAVRIGFFQARVAERDAGHEAAILHVVTALDKMRNEASAPGEDVGAIRTAIGIYAQAFTIAPAPGDQPSVVMIESELGKLEVSDEALLREPLLGMRIAETAFSSGADPSSARQFSRSAEIFRTRLDETAIPDGLRVNLARQFAVYEHDVLNANNAKQLARGSDETTRRSAVHAVETAIANADRVLTAEQRHVSGAYDRARDQLWLLLGITLVGAVLMMAGGGFAFGRAVAGDLTPA